MAFLAPIPEGSHSQPFARFNKLNELQNTSTNTHRPQSRIFAASRRHTRTRYQRPERPENFTARAAAPPVRRAPELPSPETSFNSFVYRLSVVADRIKLMRMLLEPDLTSRKLRASRMQSTASPRTWSDTPNAAGREMPQFPETNLLRLFGLYQLLCHFAPSLKLPALL